MSDLCELAKKGLCCPDDLCHGSDVTLCGFDKEFHEQMSRDLSEYEPDEDDEGFDCHKDSKGFCGKAGSEECEFECPYR